MRPGVRARSLVRSVTISLSCALIVLTVIEACLRGVYAVRNAMVSVVPLPYAFGDDYGPQPPWGNGLRILRTDPDLIWRNEPNARRIYLDVFAPVWTEAERFALLRQFSPAVPDAFRPDATWEVRLNSDGFRDSEMSRTRSPERVRIACLGDSWTFGMNVNQSQSYPRRLAEWLKQDRRGTQYEVLNFGVLGYTSFQGARLLEREVLDFKPDVVVIGFAMNDSQVAGYRDKDMVGPDVRKLTTRLTDAAAGMEIFNLLKYAALRLRFRPPSIADHLKKAAEGSGGADYGAMEAWTRVSTPDFEANIRRMVGVSRSSGASVVLVDNELWEGSPYRPVLRRIAGDLKLPLVDSQAIVAKARARIEENLEKSSGLDERKPVVPPSTSARTSVVFRVSNGNVAVSKALSIVGTDAQLGALVPNTALLHDDGTNGDQRRGDGVWTLVASLPADTNIAYIYTNSGTAGQWEGLDLPHIRRLRVPRAADGAAFYLPIETFGRVYMQADNWHTDAAGYDLIGRAVATAILDVRASR